MSSVRHSEYESFGHDSFLDIVANIVGILIILVMVVSVRARDVPAGAQIDLENRADVATASSTSYSLQKDIHDLAIDIKKLDQTLAERQQERQAMATLLAATETQFNLRRAAMDSKAQQNFDLEREVANQRAKLRKTDLQRIRIAAIDPESIKIENLPTPISTAVFGKEIHFQLRGDQLAFVPLDKLVEEARGQAREKVWKLDGQPEVTEMVGPHGGFRMRYTLEKVELPLALRLETGRTGYMIRSKRWELIPTSSQLGVPIDRALQPGSEFRQTLAHYESKNTTVTVWTYPGSFTAFRALKKELYQLGFATAARPLPEGVPIAGSSNGSRSHAQ